MPAFPFLQYEKQQDRSVGQTATINSAFLIGNAFYYTWPVRTRGKGKR